MVHGASGRATESPSGQRAQLGAIPKPNHLGAREQPGLTSPARIAEGCQAAAGHGVPDQILLYHRWAVGSRSRPFPTPSFCFPFENGLLCAGGTEAPPFEFDNSNLPAQGCTLNSCHKQALYPILKSSRVLLCRTGWSAVAQSRLTATSTSQVQTGFHHVGQAVLQLLTSSDLTASASQSAGMTGMSHHTWPRDCIFNHCTHGVWICLLGWSAVAQSQLTATSDPRLKLSSPFSLWSSWDYRSPCPEREFHHVDQAGLELLSSSDPAVSASQSAVIKGMSHMSYFKLTCKTIWTWVLGTLIIWVLVISFLLHIFQSYIYLRWESCSVTLAGVH
ncbi:Protein GVQW1, partial [Plecturocebus cupreus]